MSNGFHGEEAAPGGGRATFSITIASNWKRPGAGGSRTWLGSGLGLGVANPNPKPNPNPNQGAGGSRTQPRKRASRLPSACR